MKHWFLPLLLLLFSSHVPAALLIYRLSAR